ncbi:MAG: trigger factor [Anaerolineae bacterium]|nr:trigger factor [Anaerolineae bacterium]
MSTQIEHLDNHSARLTVDVTADRVDKAMHRAAARIAKQVNSPGFRKGKAPYNVVLQRFGAAAVMEEAIEELGNEVYREALEEAQIEPYAPGSLENVETEPQMKLVFVVPKQPEVDLGNYRDIRQPLEIPEVEDEIVTETMKAMQDREALVETVDRPAQMGDQVKLHVKGDQVHPADERDHDHDHEHEHEGETKAEGEAESPKAEGETEAKAEDATPETFTTPYVDNDITAVLTDDEEKDDVLPGFSTHIVGMKAGDKKSFSLAYPADYKIEGLGRHGFNLEVEVQEVQSRTLPELNDDFAKRVTNNEVDNLLDLRIRVRKDLQDARTRDAESKFADEVLDKVIEQANVKYPEDMVNEYIDDILQSLDRNLRERGLSLEHYKRIENKSDEDLRKDYREAAIKRLTRALALGELINREKLTVSDADVDEQIDKMSEQFGEQAATFRQMLNRAENKRSIAMDLITNHAFRRLIDIAQGKNPPIEESSPEPTPEAAAASTEASTTEASIEVGAAASPVTAEADQLAGSEPSESTEVAAPAQSESAAEPAANESAASAEAPTEPPTA